MSIYKTVTEIIIQQYVWAYYGVLVFFICYSFSRKNFIEFHGVLASEG